MKKPQAENRYDYAIVGAGSAGCVLAHRLGADLRNRVLVLEAGGSNKALIVRMPAALSMPMHRERFNWGLTTEPEPHLGGRRLNLPRGKGLGGSSSINGMCYVRGNPLDYERWAALGAQGWGWANVLPYFRRMEAVAGETGPLRGMTGPLSVTRGPETNPLYRAFIEAGVEAGYARSANMNDLQHEGFGPMEMTVRGGERCSAAVAYLRPALARGNVELRTHARVTRLQMQERRTVGVEYEYRGQYERVRAREVIVCAGSIFTPWLLMRSGIGDGDALQRAGIATVQDAPGVGAGLMDHLELYVQQACTVPISLYRYMSIIGRAWVGLRWLLRRDGPGASNHFEAGAHIRSRAGVCYPDVQLHFLPLAIAYDGTALAQGHGFQVHIGMKRSKSRGWVRLNPTAPSRPPRVQFNYMSHDDDWRDMRACIRLAREVFAQPAFAPYRGEELAPGAGCVSHEELGRFIREKVESAYHPCGTCRMGTDAAAVVDPKTMRVRGVEGLRVVDASVMPQATAGDLNAPTMMLAERAADLILGRSLPAAEGAPLLIDPRWETHQRSPAITRDLSMELPDTARLLARERVT